MVASEAFRKIANLLLVLKTLYHGTAVKDALISEGCYVTPLFSRAVKYARYPGNGEGIDLGYIYAFVADDADVDWDERQDVEQGKLKRDIRALRYTICDIPLNIFDRDSPINIRPDGSCIWKGPADKREIIWVPIAD
jgi:hypothetical protein